MKVTEGHITEELLCAMRVHLMNETEMHVFCPKDVRVWEENCHNVEFLNFTAISVGNELAMTKAFRNSLHRLLDSYSTTSTEDENILSQYDVTQGESTRKNKEDNKGNKGNKDSDGNKGSEEGVGVLGPILTSVIRLRLREKNILLSALTFLDTHEKAIHNGTVPFQLELKAKERIDANKREEERIAFIQEIQKRVAIKVPLAVIEVNLGDSIPKVNLTLQEGQSLHDVVVQFCTLHNVGGNDVAVLESALGKRVQSPAPLSLLLGVILPSGDRRILGVPAGEQLDYHPFLLGEDVMHTSSLFLHSQ